MSAMTRRTRIVVLLIAVALFARLIYTVYDYYEMQEEMWHTPLF